MATKQETLDRYWDRYIDYWREAVKEVSTPPTEDDFWLWYALKAPDKVKSTMVPRVSKPRRRSNLHL